ncbi:hypothetical protein NFI96_032876, partial [Prochilodus magdalenae]
KSPFMGVFSCAVVAILLEVASVNLTPSHRSGPFLSVYIPLSPLPHSVCIQDPKIKEGCRKLWRRVYCNMRTAADGS